MRTAYASSPLPLWLELYNAKDRDALYALFYREASALRRAANLLRHAFPEWMDAASGHWKRYKTVVSNWVMDKLTDADWKTISQWTGEHRAWETLFVRPQLSRFNLGLWLIRGMKMNDFEPFTEAYRQVLEHMVEERLGTMLHPQFCGACQRLFVPTKITQRWCSSSCANRMLQRRWRARHKPATPPRAAAKKTTTPSCDHVIPNESINQPADSSQPL
jgi:hypothetical protein